MTTSEPSCTTFEAFQVLLAGLLKVDIDEIRPEAYFITDLNVDSLRLLDLLLGLEKMGIPMPLELAWEIQTVGDAYAYCQEQLAERRVASPQDSG